MMGIKKPVETHTLSVNRQRILRQIVRTDREKIYLMCQLCAHHDGGRRLDHNAEFHLVRHRHTFLREFRTDVAADALDLLYLPDRGDHREHDSDFAVRRCAVQRPQLCAEHLGARQTDADGTQTHGRVFFFIEVEIVRLLVRANVQRADDNTFAAHTLRDRLISLKLLVLGRIVAALQVQKFRAEQADAAAVILQNRINICRRADIAVDHHIPAVLGHIRLALELIEQFFQRLLLGLPFEQTLALGVIRFHDRLAGLAVNDGVLALHFRLQRISCTDNGRNAHRAGQNRRV